MRSPRLELLHMVFYAFALSLILPQSGLAQASQKPAQSMSSTPAAKSATKDQSGAAKPSPNGTAPVQSQTRKTTMSEKGRVIGIGGIFFKSPDAKQMKEWYGKNLGLADSGHGVMLPWREADNPDSEQMTVWSVFPDTTKYFEPSQASFMVNYIVDDMDALLERLAKAGVKIAPKRQDESYGRFAWIYDPDGNKIELWQPIK